MVDWNDCINGSPGDVYEELNALNPAIRSSGEARAKDKKLREEWIANITHDLKTPNKIKDKLRLT